MQSVALIEDNPDNRMLIEVLLDDRFALSAFEDGASALAGMLRNPPDLVLLDISLPRMDGMEICRRMKAIPELRSVPVIALTAHAMAGDRERFLAAGFDGYVSKPIVDEQVLFDAIDTLLEGRTS